MRLAPAVVVVAVAALSGCGGGDERSRLAWSGEPEVLQAPTAERAKILRGSIRNRSDERLDLEAAELRLSDADGDTVRGNAIFLSGYVRPGDPQNRGPGLPVSDQEAERLGRVAHLDPGETAPLVVSWRERDGRPVRVEHPGGSLPLP